MRTLTKRAQTVLTEDQYRLLERLSKKAHKPISTLIREAVSKVYFEQAARERRKEALKKLLSLDAPVADWKEMEREITRGAIE